MTQLSIRFWVKRGKQSNKIDLISTTYITVGTENREIRKENTDFLLIDLKKSQKSPCKGLQLPKRKGC